MATPVTFDPKGPALTVEVRCGYAQAGAYILKLWDANKVVQSEEGTFFHPEDDSYTLQGLAKEQNGRLLQCTATVEVIPPIKQFAVLLTVWQGGKQVGSLTASGETDDSEVTRSLFATLTAGSTK